jgi:outer membrane lipoprotein-sorting protein
LRFICNILNMRTLIILPAILFWFVSVGLAQNTYSKKSDSDPKAKQILDKLKKNYEGYSSMEVSFEVSLEFPKQKPEVQKGSLIQSGDKYQVKMTDQEVYSDGKQIWVYLKKNKQVQILDPAAAVENDMFSPKQMLRLYETENFAYAITGQFKENGNDIAEIEFKPLSAGSEYTKMRLKVNKTQMKLISLAVFSRDGSKYTIKVNSLVTNKKYTSDIFVLNTKALKGVRIEDLRID